MDGKHFDALSRSLASAGTRRGILNLLGALPVVGVLLAVLDDEEAEANRHRKSHGKPNRGHVALHKRRHGNKRQQGAKQRGTPKKNKKHKRAAQPANLRCTPESAARTCAGRCGQVPNNCETVVDCGSCACGGACPVCQTCNATTGRCETNPPFVGQACGLPGQVCQDVGTCVCDAASCLDGQRCNGLVCVCDATSCPTGCCDGNRTCRINDDDACGTGGGGCTRCTNACVNGACSCASGCPTCQTCNRTTGQCGANPASEGTSCGAGRRCAGGHCVCDATSCPTGCCDDTAVCHIDDDAACGTAGGMCTNCASPGEACEAGSCCTKAGSSATAGAPCCAGLTACADGVCKANCCAGVSCPPAGTCQNQGICNPATGLCSPPTPNTGAACTTGDPCTIDTCQSGVCTPVPVEPGRSCGNGRVCQADGSCQCSGDSCGACATCNGTSGHCDPITCSAGQVCSGGVCGVPPRVCKGEWEQCERDDDCCSDQCRFAFMVGDNYIFECRPPWAV